MTSTIKKCCLTSHPEKQPLNVAPTWREQYIKKPRSKVELQDNINSLGSNSERFQTRSHFVSSLKTSHKNPIEMVYANNDVKDVHVVPA